MLPEILDLIEIKLKICLSAITNMSISDSDVNAAEAAEHLASTYQIILDIYNKEEGK